MKHFVSVTSMFFLGFHGNIHIYGETEVILFLLAHLIVWHLGNAQVNFQLITCRSGL